MGSLASDRKALSFSAGGVRLALRLAHVREILAVPPDAGEVILRGEPVPTAFVSTVLGLPAGGSGFALVTEGDARVALRVEALHGIIDLAEAEVFQLPARTPLPQPPPFAGAIVARGEVALELAVSTLGFAPLEPAEELPPPPDGGPAPGLERELRFCRSGRTYAVPLSMLEHILEAPRVARVPLTPASHRGLLHHARALHPVVDVGVLYGDAPSAPGRTVLLVDAGGTGVGVIADRVVGVAEGGDEVTRPPWDALFGV